MGGKRENRNYERMKKKRKAYGKISIFIRIQNNSLPSMNLHIYGEKWEKEN